MLMNILYKCNRQSQRTNFIKITNMEVTSMLFTIQVTPQHSDSSLNISESVSMKQLMILPLLYK